MTGCEHEDVLNPQLQSMLNVVAIKCAFNVDCYEFCKDIFQSAEERLSLGRRL